MLLTLFPEAGTSSLFQGSFNMCQENQEDIFDRVIIQDKTWVHHYDPETQAHSWQWKHLTHSPTPPLQKRHPWQARSCSDFCDQHKVLQLQELTTLHYCRNCVRLSKSWSSECRRKVSASNKTTPLFTTLTLARWKRGPVVMTFLVFLILVTLHHRTFTSFCDKVKRYQDDEGLISEKLFMAFSGWPLGLYKCVNI